jgi:integrase/recombinase XerD
MLQQEATIRLIGKITLENPMINQLQLRDIISSVLSDYNISTKETSLIVSDLDERIMMFLAVKKLDNLSKRTIYNYNLQLRNFASFICKPLNSIETNDIRIYMIHRAKTLQPSSMVNLIDILKTFFGWYKAEGILNKDPTKNIKNTKVPHKIKEILTLEELELMRMACENPREKCVIEVLIATGIRVSELSNVNIKDINWSNMTMNILQAKGQKDRVVCFSPRAKIYIKQYLKSRTDDCEALFITSKGIINRLGIRSLERSVKEIAKRSGVKKNVFCHLYRSNFASTSIAHGASIYSVQKLLGHSTISTTEKYITVTDKYLRDEYDKHCIS